MNDSKNSSKGLLTVTHPSNLSPEELKSIRAKIEPLADEMDLTPMALKEGITIATVIDYRPLLSRLCDAVERLAAQGEPPAVSEEIAPPALNQRPTGLNSRG